MHCLQELHAYERRDHPVPEAQVQPWGSPADVHAGAEEDTATGLSPQRAEPVEARGVNEEQCTLFPTPLGR